ncbi:MAG: class A beta-lactamase-related serine hydrolase [Acidimicrobiales bacterium]|nr:beta-lactamase family protein [Hyphomonadaceae bacterium]RZV34838.1 MAG: class A beta-lactamase-related serine hydrolase [Acidimicrobiales bacterium]
MSISINGTCDPAFQNVAEAFERNFVERGEVGASVCVRIAGETVVDLWGGYTSSKKKHEWQEDTISIVFSCTKAATALCAQILIDRSLLKLDEKVEAYWPEFATNGKENVTVRMMLNHSSAVPAIRKPVKPGGFADWDYMCTRLAKTKPYWQPGTANGYHMATFGWTVGELVRRVSGKSLGTFFKDEIADPLDLDFHIGLAESEFARMATMIPFVPSPSDFTSDFAKTIMSNPMSIQFAALLNNGAWDFNAEKYWKAEIGGAGGASNARGLAGMFAPFAGGDGTFLSNDRIEDMRTPSMETDKDKTLLIPTRFGQGFMLNMDNRETTPGEGNSAVIGDRAFGHVGMGGSIGFADPEADLAFGYSMNKMGGGILLNERGQSLVDAAYSSRA